MAIPDEDGAIDGGHNDDVHDWEEIGRYVWVDRLVELVGQRWQGKLQHAADDDEDVENHQQLQQVVEHARVYIRQKQRVVSYCTYCTLF